MMDNQLATVPVAASLNIFADPDQGCSNLLPIFYSSFVSNRINLYLLEGKFELQFSTHNQQHLI